jgi:hypothetical protein
LAASEPEVGESKVGEYKERAELVGDGTALPIGSSVLAVATFDAPMAPFSGKGLRPLESQEEEAQAPAGISKFAASSSKFT